MIELEPIVAVPRGFEQLQPHAPRPEWLVVDHRIYEWVRLEAEHERRAKPWTLLPLAEGERLVAVKRTLWMRLVTWWLNRGRREERARRMWAAAERYAELDRRRALGIPLEDGTQHPSRHTS